MKLTKPHQTLAVSALLLSITAFSLPASAQTQNPNNVNTTAGTTPRSIDVNVNRDSGFNWGWLGLLGLGGLLGLTGKNRDHYDAATRYRDPNEVTRSR